MKIAVIGAGIGGLTFALSAQRLGLEVTVYEAVAALKPQGVGINLQPNAVRELTALGLGDKLAAMAVRTSELAYFSRHGQLIWKEPRGLAAGYHWPQYSIHRGRLQMLLLTAVRERLGDNAVVTGRQLTSFEAAGNTVTARFSESSSGEPAEDIQVDILVGADGIHSAVRKGLHPIEGEPVYGPWLMYRGAVEADPFLSGRTMISAGTRDQRIVAYPMSLQTSSSEKVLVNWVASLPRPAEGQLPPEFWNQRIDKRLLLQAFDRWRFPWLDVHALIQNTTDVFVFPFVDREPLPFWSRGRVTLIGDAAHPMYPIGSQAGSQAIVDGHALAAAIAAIANPEDALLQFEALRRPAMSELAVRNRELGAESVLQLVEERAPQGFARLEDVISAEELETAAAGFKRLAGIDVASVNSRPPWFGRT